ncbi:proline iminopeptidase [Melghiribacillus thermohalophilus]|uniref:Proline iminopeptidase n=1 Tax=Melghiribacillus thermohalophilus TaxID=1324956 RepID=A0A4R3MWY7_9BACI|nr:alpha/beta fold hydrolase [Melghiribacillus thermohalophilus]TCT20874.1 proline iminopeptidase [Melghiribacillus thermohalophilus]
MWTRKMVSTKRGDFEVFVCGEGEPLCVTHLYSEFNERGDYFSDRFVNQFTVYLVNLKETGSSSRVKDDKELSMKETVKDLEALRKALNVEKWGFAGHSTGGMIGLVYGASYPESLTKLMVGGAAASQEYMEHPGSIYSRQNPLNPRLKEIFSILKSKEASKEEKAKAGREWTEMSLHHPEKFDEYFAKPSSGRVVNRRLDYYSFQELPEYDIREDLKNIGVPTIVYCGRHDAQCPLDCSKEIHDLIPASKLYIFEHSNHVPYLEEQELFDRMVADFSQL